MSAAATAAGYLYASGRLRGRNGREGETHEGRHESRHDAHHESQRAHHPEQKRDARPVKVAVYEPAQPAQPAAPDAPKKAPKIQYRTRRWRPDTE